MKFFTPAIVALALSTGVGFAKAGNAQGLVSGIFVHTPGVLMFQVGTIINGAPSCAAVLHQWAISLSDPMAKSMMALLLSAQAQGKQVFVRGYSNTCSDWGDRELPSFALLID
jgi:hypothetical protein